MSLNANITLNITTCVAGASPAPMATLTVFNPNAVPVAVVAVQLAYYNAVTLAPINAAIAPQVPATSPGQTVVVPALGSITFGPMPVAVGSASSMNPFMFAPIANVPLANPQLAQPPQTQILIGGTLYGSDGSANEIGRAGLFVSYQPAPPPTFQGGYLQLNGPNNFVTALEMGVL